MKKLIFTLSLVFMVFISVTNTLAQTKPTPEAAMSFLNFYYEGQGQGVVLADVKVCTQVEQNDCVGNKEFNSLIKGIQYYLWMLYVVPKDDEIDDIIIQFNQRGLTRFTREVSVSGSIRFRTWRLFTLHHAGEWEVKVLHDKGTEVETLRTLTLTVIE